jgi:hypothetical protein
MSALYRPGICKVQAPLHAQRDSHCLFRVTVEIVGETKDERIATRVKNVWDDVETCIIYIYDETVTAFIESNRVVRYNNSFVSLFELNKLTS